MPKFCPKCGNKLQYENTSFCDNCGFNLKGEISKKENFDISADKELFDDDEPVSNISLKDLGSKLEAAVEKILMDQGYKTKRNFYTKTETGIRELDIIAKKTIGGSEILLGVECKNYKASNQVPLKDMVYFIDLLKKKNIKIGLFVTSSTFSDQAKRQAELSGIKTWDFEELKEKYLRAAIGRMKTVSKEFFKYAMPENVFFNDAIKIDLVNSDKVKLVTADLIWRPFNKISYSLNATCRTPDKEVHKIKNRGDIIIDAFDGNLITSSIFSKERYYANELKGNPNENYKCVQNGEHTIKKINPNIRRKEILRRAIHEIIDLNTEEIAYEVKKKERQRVDYDLWDDSGPEYETVEYYDTKYYTFVPKRKDIVLEFVKLIYVPKWEIEFVSGEYTYSREILAHTGRVIEDQISICPDHKFRNFLKVSLKQTIAVCEKCGKALCDKHIFQCPTCKKWLCEDHGSLCVNCGNHYCTDHINKYCNKCGTPLCNNCKTTCPICGNEYCEKHMVKCDKCHQKICIDCVTISRKKLLFKKYTCKNCQ
jgi:hypothetical protein